MGSSQYLTLNPQPENQRWEFHLTLLIFLKVQNPMGRLVSNKRSAKV
jgi:hypothetical protein